MHWSVKHEKLVLSSQMKLNISPVFDKYMEWGFFDGSIRFFTSDSKKVIRLQVIYVFTS